MILEIIEAYVYGTNGAIDAAELRACSCDSRDMQV